MTDPGPSQERAPPSNADLCVKALEAMESTGDASPASQASAEALGKAMQDLSAKQPTASKPGTATSTRVNAAHIALIMEEMEVSKPRATEALRSCGGNVTEALQKFLRPS